MGRYQSSYKQCQGNKQKLADALMDRCKKMDIDPFKVVNIDSIISNGQVVDINSLQKGDSIQITGCIQPMHNNHLFSTESSNQYGAISVNEIAFDGEDFVLSAKLSDGSEIMITTLPFQETWRDHYYKQFAELFVEAAKEIKGNDYTNTLRVLDKLGIQLPETADEHLLKSCQLLFSQERYVPYLEQYRDLSTIESLLINDQKYLRTQIGQLVTEHIRNMQAQQELANYPAISELAAERNAIVNPKALYPRETPSFKVFVYDDSIPIVRKAVGDDFGSFDSSDRSINELDSHTCMAHHHIVDQCLNAGVPLINIPMDQLGNFKSAGTFGRPIDICTIKVGDKIKLPKECFDIVTGQSAGQDVEVLGISSRNGHLIINTTAGLASTKDYTLDVIKAFDRDIRMIRGEKVEELRGPTMKIVQDVDHREAFFERD